MKDYQNGFAGGNYQGGGYTGAGNPGGGYHDIHCPYCGTVLGPREVRYSISEFVEEIFNQRLDEKYNDNILGQMDPEEINLVLDNDFLWDLSEKDIADCFVDEMFVLSGENLIKRFGPRAVELLHGLSYEAVDEIAQSSNVSENLKSDPAVWELVVEILKNVSPERLMRTEVRTEDRDVAVLNLIRYAKTDKVLFKIAMKIEMDQDDRGNIISKDIRSRDERIICKSKRCSNCGNGLSKMSGKYEEKIVSFIGSPAAGKSAYLTAAINKLLTTGKSEYGIEAIFDYQSSDYITFNESCLNPYSKGFAITKTNQGTFPQLSIALKNSMTKKTLLYTFVDIPGETFIDENGCNVSDILANRRIIKHADVVWYCVSAKQLFASKIGRVRRARNDGAIENEEMNDLRILGMNTITFANALFKADEKKPAVALVLTKSDLLADYIAENVFDGDPRKDESYKKDYFKTICTAPRNSDGSENDYDYYDGEPINLDYLKGGRLAYQKFMNATKNIGRFIVTNGEPQCEAFVGNICTAFDKPQCPCFSEASYGRSPVEKYSMDTAVRFLLANKHRLAQRDYDEMVDIFGERALEAFETEGERLPMIKEIADINYIQNLYKKLNPIYPFGIMSVLEWTFAYTGFVECVETDGENWNVVPTDGWEFNVLRSRLALESEGENILGARMPDIPAPGNSGKGHFKLFGK